MSSSAAKLTIGGGKLAKLSQKVNEVKEVAQNKSDADIAKVLEYFDNDVGKAIDAFVNDGGKTALAGWAQIKMNKKKQQNESETSASTSEATGATGATSKKEKTNNKQRQSQAANQQQQQHQHQQSANNNPLSKSLNARKTNLNDLVASVINQYTSTSPSITPATTPLSTSLSHNVKLLAATSQLSPPIDVQTKTHEQEENVVNGCFNGKKEQHTLLLDRLNPAASASSSSSHVFTLPTANGESTTIGGYKVTLFGVNGNGTGTTTTTAATSCLSSTQSSPSSMSIVSNASSSNNNSNNSRPSLLDLSTGTIPLSEQLKLDQLSLNGKQQQLRVPCRTFNTAYLNPNSKLMLEKHQKDLQRQTVQLNKIGASFGEELTRSKLTLKQTFAQLRALLNECETSLEKQLAASGQTGASLLKERQLKAADLRLLADNSQHLNEQETLELKADIKHFVSERQLDEEFSTVKLLHVKPELLELVADSLNKLASVHVIKNNYASERPKDLLTASTPLTPQPTQQQLSVSHNNQQPLPQRVNGHNGNTSHVNNSNKNFIDKNNNKNLINGENGAAAGSTAAAVAAATNTTNGAHNKHQADEDGGEFIEVKKPQRNKFKQQQQQQQQQQNHVNGNNHHATSNGNSYNKQSYQNGTAGGVAKSTTTSNGGKSMATGAPGVQNGYKPRVQQQQQQQHQQTKASSDLRNFSSNNNDLNKPPVY